MMLAKLVKQDSHGILKRSICRLVPACVPVADFTSQNSFDASFCQSLISLPELSPISHYIVCINNDCRRRFAPNRSANSLRVYKHWHFQIFSLGTFESFGLVHRHSRQCKNGDLSFVFLRKFIVVYRPFDNFHRMNTRI